MSGELREYTVREYCPACLEYLSDWSDDWPKLWNCCPRCGHRTSDLLFIPHHEAGFWTMARRPWWAYLLVVPLLFPRRRRWIRKP